MNNIKGKLRSLLKRTENYTKTDMVYLAKGGFWLTVSNLLVSGLVFITSIVFAHKIPAETYGTYKFILSIYGILSITTLSGMGSVISQAVSRGYEGSIFAGLRAKIAWGMIGCISSIGISIYYYINGNATLAIAFLIAAIFVPVMDSFILYQDYLLGKKKFNVSSIFSIISQVVSAIVTISVLFFTKNLFIIFLSYVLVWTTLRITFFIITIKNFPPNENVDKETISYGKHTSFIDVIATVIGSIDQILIFHYLGAAELALYTFAIAPPIQLVSLFRNIPTLAMPKMATRPIQEIDKLLNKRIAFAFIASIIVAIIYILLAPYIFKIFFPKYIGSIIYSQVFIATILFSIPQTILSPAVGSKINYIPKKMLYIWNIPGIISTLLIFIFIKHIGIYSVIAGRVSLVAISFLLGYMTWNYIVKKDIENSMKNSSQ